MKEEPIRMKRPDGSIYVMQFDRSDPKMWALETWVEQPTKEKETPMSADIDEEEHGTAAAFDVENGCSSEAIVTEMGANDGHRASTHWRGCFITHRLCALAEILRLRAYIRKLEGEVVHVHEAAENHDELVQELQTLNEQLESRRDRVMELSERLVQMTSSRDEYKALYMNAFAAVRALAKLVVPEEPKG